MANFKRNKPRQQVCSPANSWGRLGNTAEGTKRQFRAEPESIPAHFGPAQTRRKRRKARPFVVMARYIGPKKPWWFFRDDRERQWHRWGRYQNHGGATQAIAAFHKSPFGRRWPYEFEIQNTTTAVEPHIEGAEPVV